jgi:hypothetical protein
VIVVFARAARCIMERPAKEHFKRSRIPSSLASPMGENSGQRAINVYSAVAAIYTAPKYSAAVGDALTR